MAGTASKFFSGVDGAATFGGVARYGQKWNMEMESTEIRVTNFESPTAEDGSKWDEFIGGFTRGTVTIECLDDPTQAQPQQGAATTYVLTVGGAHTISGDGVYIKQSRSVDIDGAAKRIYTVRMSGPPTIT